MTPEKWETERIYLKGRFELGTITNATRKELERYLVVLANTRNLGGVYFDATREAETKSFATIIRHLLQIRLGEELHEKSHKISLESHRISVRSFWVSIIAAGVAAVAALFAGLLVLVESEKYHTTNPLPPVNAPASQLLPAKLPLIESKLPQTNGISHPLTNHAETSQVTP